MINKIKAFIKEYNMIARGDTVVCGLSGGADSVCLLLAMNELSGQLGFSVRAIHVNHQLRGAESDRDEEFCRSLCERLDVPFKSVRVDVNGYAASCGLSTEDAARKLRYDAFSRNYPEAKTATAHNANDNLETAILNLARGTGLKGLAGIPPVRGNIIRPLLTVTRSEIEQFLSIKGQDHVTDSTNLSDDYTRNKIRHKIIPLLEEINSFAVETSVNSLSALRSENALIDTETEQLLEKCRRVNALSGASEYHEVLRRRAIARMLSDNSLPYSAKRLKEADEILLNGGKINISGDIYLISDGSTLELKKIPQKTENTPVSSPMTLGENCIFPGKRLICKLVDCDNLKKSETVHKNLTFQAADYDKIVGRAVVRNRKYGDRIQLRGRNFTSSVKKLINEKIPPDQRGSLHFIEDEQGLVYAEGIGIAQRVAPDEKTVNFLVISVESTN